MHFVKATSSNVNLKRGYLDVIVSIFQIYHYEPVPWAYMLEDLFQSQHPEWVFHQHMIQVSEIEDEPEIRTVQGQCHSSLVLRKWLAFSRLSTVGAQAET